MSMLDVLLIQRASTNGYPPVLNQATILADDGFDVAIHDGGRDADYPLRSDAIQYWRPLMNRDKPKSLAGRIFENALFFTSARRLVKRGQPKVCILFDSPTIGVLPWLRGRQATVAHFHEYPEYVRRTHRNWRIHCARRMARQADIVVVPDKYRARALRFEVGLREDPRVVRNCPMKIRNCPEGRLSPFISDVAEHWRYTVLFQGSLSDTYYLEEIVRSMRKWPPESGFVCVGPDRTKMGARLVQLAREGGYAARLVVIPAVPYSLLFSLTVDADLMITTVRPKTFNKKYSAGASNKRFEAMACGVPQVTNIGPGVSELIEQTGCGVCLDPGNIEQLASTIAGLLEARERREKMAVQARRAHLETFNYEDEFSLVLEELDRVL